MAWCLVKHSNNFTFTFYKFLKLLFLLFSYKQFVMYTNRVKPP